MKGISTAILLLLVLISGIWGDNLWEEDSGGFFTDSNFLSVGQVLQVVLDSETNFSFSSSFVGNTSLTLEFSGGEAGDLFSFLPAGKSGTSESEKGGEELSLKAVIAARVREIESSGTAFISGSRTIRVHGEEESLIIEGWIQPQDISSDMSVPFSRIADSRLIFTTFLDPGDETLKEEDISRIFTQETDIQETLSPETEQPRGEDAETKEIPSEGYNLNEEKKKQLLLQYMNRFLDIIFQ